MGGIREVLVPGSYFSANLYVDTRLLFLALAESYFHISFHSRMALCRFLSVFIQDAICILQGLAMAIASDPMTGLFGFSILASDRDRCRSRDRSFGFVGMACDRHRLRCALRRSTARSIGVKTLPALGIPNIPPRPIRAMP